MSINYRLLAPAGCTGTNGTSPTCLAAPNAAQHDAQAAVRWLRANQARYRIDVDRIAMFGSSTGGITALLAAYRSDDPGTSGNPAPSSTISAAISLSGGVPGAAAYTGPGDAPALLFHGTADTSSRSDGRSRPRWPHWVPASTSTSSPSPTPATFPTRSSAT